MSTTTTNPINERAAALRVELAQAEADGNLDVMAKTFRALIDLWRTEKRIREINRMFRPSDECFQIGELAEAYQDAHAIAREFPDLAGLLTCSLDPELLGV